MDRQVMSLVSFLSSTRINHLVRSDNSEVKVDVLKGKIVGLLFSAISNKSAANFVNKLSKVYDETRNTNPGFEIVFVSGDTNEESFKQSMAKMPWLAVPYKESLLSRIQRLARRFKVEMMPALVLVAADGSTVLSTEGYGLITRFGSKAFPFTQERIQELDKIEDMDASKLPKELKDAEHDHRLLLVKDPYQGSGLFTCDKCGNDGCGWCYHCAECSYDLHLDCIKPVILETLAAAVDQSLKETDDKVDGEDEPLLPPQVGSKVDALVNDVASRRKQLSGIALVLIVLLILGLLVALNFGYVRIRGRLLPGSSPK